ncbi:MAG: M14 family zinc carboxypeptidase, partial [Anaerovorax sp.]|nr:M14 family zinc carboxypeptidase [Anaerovorax sp.]
MIKNRKRFFAVLLSVVLVLSGSFVTFAASNYEEAPLPRNLILYSEIGQRLEELQALNPSLMNYEVIGQSLEGRDLYLVTITDAEGMKHLDRYQKFMQDAVNNPEDALKALKTTSDYKVPVFFNASIHGNETPGTDGVLKLIETLLTDKSPQIQAILKDCVVLINVSQNPDGRVNGLRENASVTDLNRDYITQSQPETKAVVKHIATKWFPTSMLDLHGFMTTDNVLLEPCTIPHNPNYEYDLLFDHALPHAETIADAITQTIGWDVDIPYQVWEDGWDDYPPIFTPQYFMYLGTISHTLEVKYANQEGVETVYAACIASLKYAVENKQKLLENQFKIYERGVKGIEEEKDIHFPYAYVLPMNEKQQSDSLQAAKMIQHMLNNGIQIKIAEKPFEADGITYPEGTYVVPLNQGLRGLINTMLWKGEDVSTLANAMYDISAYSFPLLCGFDAIAVDKAFTADLASVAEITMPAGSMDAAKNSNYVILVENNDAYKAANILVKEGFKVYRSMDMVSSYPAGTFVIPEQNGIFERLSALVKEKAIQVKSVGETHATLLPVTLKKIAVVEEDGGTYTAMKEMGFDVTAVSYKKLNEGYDLKKNGFNALVVSGSQYFWEDSYDDTGTTWSLDARAIKQLKAFAKENDYIGMGYAGVMLNEEIKKLETEFYYIEDEDGGQTAENGICTFNADRYDPITFNFGKEETIFAFKPIWFKGFSGSVVANATYGKGKDMYLAGFWHEPQKVAGRTAI